jgi:hypothetical protein
MKKLPALSLLLVFAVVAVLFVHFHSLVHLTDTHNQTSKLVRSPPPKIADIVNRYAELNHTLTVLHQRLNWITSKQQNALTLEVGSLATVQPITTAPTQPTHSRDSAITTSAVTNPHSHLSIVPLPPVSTKKLRAVIFTMDSIATYEANSLVGGASGRSNPIVLDFSLL